MGTATYEGEALAAIRRAARASAETLVSLGTRVRAGVTTAELEAWAVEEMRRRGGRSSVLGCNDFPGHICTSRNAEICNGVPRTTEVLQDGDVISLDVAVEIAGFHANVAATFGVGTLVPEVRRLVRATEDCLAAAIAVVRPGGRLGDVSAAIGGCAQAAGFAVITEFGGHGVGQAHLEAPFVANTGEPGTGIRMRPGMVFTIEPMLALGTPEVEMFADAWSAVTKDRLPAAHCKHTVCVTEDGCEVLTAWSDADLQPASL